MVPTDARVRNVIVKYTPDLGHHAMLLAELDVKKKSCPFLVTYGPLEIYFLICSVMTLLVLSGSTLRSLQV